MNTVTAREIQDANTRLCSFMVKKKQTNKQKPSNNKNTH